MAEQNNQQEQAPKKPKHQVNPVDNPPENPGDVPGGAAGPQPVGASPSSRK